MNVAAVLMEILRAAGVRYLFGNPGTTELPFLDALPDSGLEYVLGLQEATAVAAADGYAQASGQVGVANVHVAPGLANSLSILHNAARSKSPLLVTAGQQDTRFLMDEPILAGDLVRMAEQFTKWSYEIRRAEEAPVARRRARARRAGVPPHEHRRRPRVVAGRPLSVAGKRAQGARGVRRAPDRRRERLHVVPPHRGRAVSARAPRDPDRRRSLGDRPQ